MVKRSKKVAKKPVPKKVIKKEVKSFTPNWWEYNKLLQDPRWQKKRLEIFQRDGWQCKWCFAKDKTLHLHHKKYTTRFPWQEKSNNLQTLCKICHAKQHNNR